MQVIAILSQLVYNDCLKWEGIALKEDLLHGSLLIHFKVYYHPDSYLNLKWLLKFKYDKGIANIST